MLAQHRDLRIEINIDHPVAARALQTGEPVLVSILVSSVFTALNLWKEDVTDVHEATFHRLHIDQMLARRRSGGL